jgi:hypothetical protein
MSIISEERVSPFSWTLLTKKEGLPFSSPSVPVYNLKITI